MFLDILKLHRALQYVLYKIERMSYFRSLRHIMEPTQEKITNLYLIHKPPPVPFVFNCNNLQDHQTIQFLLNVLKSEHLLLRLPWLLYGI